MSINDIVDSIKNRYSNRKEYKLTPDFGGPIINFTEDCLTKEEKMENKLANKYIKQSKINYKVTFVIYKNLKNNHDINIKIDLLFNSYNDIDTIYDFNLEKDNITNNTEYLNEISYEIDHITNFVLNIKIDISEIKKIFIETFTDRLKKYEINNTIRLLEKYKYLDKNNISDIINIIDSNRAYTNYLEYKNAIFKLIIKYFKQYLNKIKDIME